MKYIDRKIILLSIFISLFHVNLFPLHNEWYQAPTTVLTDKNDKYFALDPTIETFAKQRFGLLNRSPFFDTKKIVNAQWVNKKFRSMRTSTFSEIPLTTIDGEKISFAYFDRGKDAIVVIAPGFTNPAEKMAPLVDIFQDYDVAIINFRGLGIHTPWTFNPLNWLTKLLIETTNHTQLSAKEELDVFAVVDFLRNSLGYKRVLGVGICIGSNNLAKAQALAEQEGRQLLDKLVLDGMFYSIDAAMNKIVKNPKLICNPQKGDGSQSWLAKSKILNGPFQWFVKASCQINFDTTIITHYLPLIRTTPVLYFYGKDDKMVVRDEFEKILETLNNTRKTIFITSNPHVINHIKQKELYTLLCRLFFELEDHDIFVDALHNVEKLQAEFVNIETSAFLRSISID